MGTKLRDIPIGSSLPDTTYIVGVNDTGNPTTSIDYRWTLDSLAAYFLGQYSAQITVVSAGTTVEDDFFSQPILTITANGQEYIVGVDFTQDTSTSSIQMGSGFYAGQIIVARR